MSTAFETPCHALSANPCAKPDAPETTHTAALAIRHVRNPGALLIDADAADCTKGRLPGGVVPADGMGKRYGSDPVSDGDRGEMIGERGKADETRRCHQLRVD